MKSCHYLCILTFLVLLAFSPGRALAQESPGEADVQPSQVLADAQNVRLLGETGGYLGAIYVVGNRAYVGEGYRVTILDWSNPAQPAVLGRSALLPGYIYDLVVVDELAYVANGSGGLRVLNVGNPAAPIEIGAFQGVDVVEITIAGNLALLGSQYSESPGELHLVNIQNPVAPVFVGKYQPPTTYDIGNTEVAGTTAYLNDRAGLRILDIGNPSTPRETAFYSVTGALADFQIVDNTAYLAAGVDGLRILDLSQPAAPREIGSYNTAGNARAVQVVGKRAYVADGAAGLAIVDVANPRSPALLGTFPSPADAFELRVVGSTVYLLDSLNQVQAIGAANPKQPVLGGRYAVPLSPGAVYVASSFGSDTYAYVADSYRGLRVVTFSSPTELTTVGFHPTPDSVMAVVADFSYAYVAALSSGLRILDISDPGKPKEVGFLDTPGSARDVKLLGGYAYIADNAAGLRIIDIRTRTAPVEVGFFDPYTGFSGPREVELVTRSSTNYAFLADGDLRIVNVTNRAAPQQVGLATTPGNTIAVAVSGDFAYALDDDHTLRVFNVANPAAPAQVASYRYNTSGAVTFRDSIALAGNTAYIADGISTARVFNITNPAVPVELGYYNFGKWINGIFAVDRTLYVAGGDAGLFVLHYPDCYTLSTFYTGKGASPRYVPDNSPGCAPGAFVPRAFVTLNASPAPGWQISRWLGTDNDGSTLATNKLDMPAADFGVLVQYTTPCLKLTLTATGGEIPPTATPANSATCPSGQYVAGETISLHAEPPEGLRIAGWSGVADGAGKSSDNTLVMPGSDHTVAVTYEPIPVTVQGDLYEQDDECVQAQALNADGVAQTRTLHRPGEQDWVRFAATAGTRYRIEVTIPGNSPADVILEVYAQCANAPFSSFNQSFAPGARLDMTATATAPVFLRLTDVNPAAGGENHTYELSVRRLEDASAGQSNRALILVGGSLANPDRLQKNISHVTEGVYAYFRNNGYGGANITYLSNDVNAGNRNGAATLGALQTAITVWAAQRLSVGGELTLYLMDHGDPDTFYIDKARGQVLTPQQLDSWLDQLEAAVPELKLTILIEACYAGSFIEGEQSISKDEPGRLVIASTNAQLLAYASERGAYFSDLILASLGQGFSLHNSFRATYGAVQELTSLQQEPWLDANGNGIPNEPADVTLATQRSAGAGAEGWAPYIVSTSVPASITDRRGTLQAVVRDDKRVRRVWAVITPPSYRPPQTSAELVPETLPTIVLNAAGNDLFAAEYAAFDELGAYKIAFYAEDDENLITLPEIVQVQAGNFVFMPVVSR